MFIVLLASKTYITKWDTWQTRATPVLALVHGTLPLPELFAIVT
jgi:hypothetical protein